MSRALRWPLAIVVSMAVLDLLVVSGAPQPLRMSAALWFLGVCTGMSFVGLWPDLATEARLALAVAMSMAIDVVVLTPILELGGFSIATALVPLQAVCLIGCALQVRRWARDRPPALTMRTG
jgi:hypothetical protein